nr:MAG: hypothetical protein ADFBMEEK_00005 [Peromyscus leucopus gammaherpesvirus]
MAVGALLDPRVEDVSGRLGVLAVVKEQARVYGGRPLISGPVFASTAGTSVDRF